jgi:hypothetical protein
MEMRDDAQEHSDKSGELPTAQQLSLYPNLNSLQPQQPSAPNIHDNLPEEEQNAVAHAAHTF